MADRKLKVFLCHASEDKDAVRDLYDKLRRDRVDPWLDTENLLPGQEWEPTIRRDIRGSDTVVVCLSRRAVGKEGFVRKEIRYALDVADEKLEDAIFIICLRLEECDVPERLKKYTWANLFEKNGYEKLLSSLTFAAERRGTIPPVETREPEIAPQIWTVKAAPLPTRQEGLSEALGDILIHVPASFSRIEETFDIQVYLSHNLTSPRRKGQDTTAMLVAEADGPLDHPVVARRVMGWMPAPNAVLFPNVPIRPFVPQTLRITNLRAHANQFGGPAPIQALTTVRPSRTSTPIPVLTHPQPTVGFVMPSFAFRIRGTDDAVDLPLVLSRSVGLNEGLLKDPGTYWPRVTLCLEFQESFPNAFTSRSDETKRTGLTDDEAADLITNGTRFLARFSGVPDNVHVFVTTKDILGEDPSTRALLISTESRGARELISDKRILPATVGKTQDGVELAGVPVHEGKCSIAWEWVGTTRDSQNEKRSVSFGVVLAWQPGQGGFGTARVTGSLAPLSTVTTASGDAPVPRYADIGVTAAAFEIRE